MTPEEEEVQQPTPEYEFNFDNMKLTDKLSQVHQEGNFIVGVTENGVRFRQRIKPNKMLTQVDGKYALVDIKPLPEGVEISVG